MTNLEDLIQEYEAEAQYAFNKVIEAQDSSNQAEMEIYEAIHNSFKSLSDKLKTLK